MISIVTHRSGQAISDWPNNYKIYIVLHDKSGIGGGLPDRYLDKHYTNMYQKRRDTIIL